MAIYKKRKNVFKKVKNIIKNAKKRENSVKYVNLKRRLLISKINKLLSFKFKIYPEFVISKNKNILLQAQKNISKLPKEKFRSKNGEIYIMKFSDKVIYMCLKGDNLNSAIKTNLKLLPLYKKELRVLRKAFIISVINKIYEIEKEIYNVKLDILKGKKYKGKAMPKDFSPAFMFGISKNANLGLFLDKRKEILLGIDLLISNLEEAREQLCCLINLLIKCLQ